MRRVFNLATASDALHLDVADAQARHTTPDATEHEAGELQAAQGGQRHRQHDRRAAIAPVLGLRVHLCTRPITLTHGLVLIGEMHRVKVT